MDSSFYQLSGREPWEVCDTEIEIVKLIVNAHLTFFNGKLKSVGSLELVANGMSGMERSILDNLEKFKSEK